MSQLWYESRTAVRIPYLLPGGTEPAVRFRLALEGENRFRWKKGSKPCLYGLWRLREAEEVKSVVLVEGESDCHTLWYHGLPALGLPGAATWHEGWADYLKDVPVIHVVVEPDAGGAAVRKWLGRSSIRDRVRIVELTDAKDVSGLHAADPAKFKRRWNAALRRATPWVDVDEKERQQRREDALRRCRSLARQSRILDRFVEVLAECGVVGEWLVAKLLFLALVSRLLTHPVSIGVRGPSSVGKSYIMEQVLRFFPQSAYYALTAMSEHALAYSEETLSHRFLVIYEAVGLQSEFASYMVRSLLSEGRVRYETVESTKDGLRPRLIERPGPTGLLVSTTAVELHPENETRLLSVTVSDTREQTRLIMQAQAKEGRTDPDFEPWHALQEFLELSETRVTIPFAADLASLVPPAAVRLRRDFRAILNLIRAHAILHQESRKRDDDGRIVACLKDYSEVRDLVADIVAEHVEATVSHTIRDTVAAVARLTGAKGKSETTVQEVAGALGLDKSAASRRVRSAVSKGYVRNLETKRGRPSRLVLGTPLPNEVELLPPPGKLRSCRVAARPEGTSTPSPPTAE